MESQLTEDVHPQLYPEQEKRTMRKPEAKSGL
jgi:hypothetical protein